MTCVSGKTSCDIVERSQSALGSPSDAASQPSIVCGAAIGAAASVECIRPKNAPTRALPGLIRRKPQRPGIVREVSRMVAARSFVRELQASSRAQSAAYLCSCSSLRRGYQMKLPGGLTPTITERWMLAGCRQA